MLHITVTKDDGEVLLDAETNGIIGAIDKGERTQSFSFLNEISVKDVYCLLDNLDYQKKKLLKQHPGLRVAYILAENTDLLDGEDAGED